jgi:hypothetical protein
MRLCEVFFFFFSVSVSRVTMYHGLQTNLSFLSYRYAQNVGLAEYWMEEWPLFLTELLNEDRDLLG